MPNPTSCLNRLLSISSAQAEELWRNAREYEEGERLPEHGARSADGHWVIRKRPDYTYTDYSGGMRPEQLCERAESDVKRLWDCKIGVIACAFVPAERENNIFTINPWVDGATPCSQNLFKTSLAPKLLHYYESTTPDAYTVPADPKQRAEPYLWDLPGSDQASVLTSNPEEPYIHDIEPLYSTHAYELYCIIDSLRLLTGKPVHPISD